MGVSYESSPLQVVNDLLQALNGLRDSKPVELVEAEMVIPFVGILAHKAALPHLGDFSTASLLTEDIERSRISDIWCVRIIIKKAQTITLKLEKYDTNTVS